MVMVVILVDMEGGQARVYPGGGVAVVEPEGLFGGFVTEVWMREASLVADPVIPPMRWVFEEVFPELLQPLLASPTLLLQRWL